MGRILDKATEASCLEPKRVRVEEHTSPKLSWADHILPITTFLILSITYVLTHAASHPPSRLLTHCRASLYLTFLTGAASSPLFLALATYFRHYSCALTIVIISILHLLIAGIMPKEKNTDEKVTPVLEKSIREIAMVRPKERRKGQGQPGEVRRSESQSDELRRRVMSALTGSTDPSARNVGRICGNIFSNAINTTSHATRYALCRRKRYRSSRSIQL